MPSRVFLPLGAVLLLLGCGKASSSDGETDETGKSGETDETGETGDEPPVEMYAVAECEAMFACSCLSPPFASLDDCIDTRSQQLAALATTAQERGLSWDATCAQSRIDRLTAGCTTEFVATPHCAAEYCPLFIGTTVLDADCNDLGVAELISECESGSVCRSGRCQEYCRVHEFGEQCNDTFLGAMCSEGLSCLYFDIDNYCGTPPAEGDYCGPEGPSCGPGLGCDYNNSMCTALSSLGESCANGVGCVLGAYCEADVCVEIKPAGEPCIDAIECESDYCEANACAPLPDQAGDSCALTYKCAEGLECDFATLICVMIEPATCEMASNGCAVEFNGICDEQASGGACELDLDHYDCGYCPDIWTDNGPCNEASGSCPIGTDPDC